MPSAADAPMSQRRKTALEVIEAYRAWDIDRMIAYRTEDCIHEIGPQSLKQPPKDNATYRAYVAGIHAVFRDFSPVVHELVEDAAGNMVTMWVSSAADSVIGPYRNEYTLLLYFNDAGDKVRRFVEFVDSACAKDFFGRLAEHQPLLPAEEGGRAKKGV